MLKFCSLFSGSSGNSIFIGCGNTKILIDAGLSAKRVIEALALIGEKPSDLSALLITHEHSDHIKGAGIISRKFDIPIYANQNTWAAMDPFLGNVAPGNKATFVTGAEFGIGELFIKTFHIPHDASEPVGFNFFAEGKKITVATDIGHVDAELAKNLEESELLLLESNHDVEMLKVGPYPWYLKKRIAGDFGHLSNEAAGEVIAHMAEKGTKRFLLGHLSQHNNFPELAYQTVCNALSERSICIGTDITLDVAMRDRVGKVIEL